MPDDVFKSVFLPLALIFVLFGMGMSLSVGDFKRVMLSPLASAVGVCCQLIVLPLTAFAVAWVLGLRGETAVGLMLLAACPGGPTSNLISHLSKGDVALSVTLTAVSSVVAVFTIPWVVGLSMTHFLGSAAAIELPFWKTLIQLMIVTLLPIALGMGIRAAKPAFADRMARPASVLSVVFLGLVILLAVLREDNLAEQFRVAGPGAVTLNVLTMVLAFYLAKLFQLPHTQQITISIEAGIQNGTLALAIALGILGNPHIAMPAVIYSLFMFVSGSLMIWRFGLRR
ncbi:MAG: bile acid:sodium symporter family protein [Terrimicrobiaceae bacterium]